ncbi:MAG: metallophosphoesterase family protein [bacterium]
MSAKLKHTPSPTRPEKGVRLYVVGDIHGRNDLLNLLLSEIYRDQGRQDGIYATFAAQQSENTPPIHNQLIFLGDYVDRGAESCGVIDTLLALQARFPDTIFLRGNHEQAMLDFLADPDAMASWLEWGGDTTLESYGIQSVARRSPLDLRNELAEKLPSAHFDFLMDLKNYYQSGDYIFVHAGLRAGVPLEEQSERDLLWIRGQFFDSGPVPWGHNCIVHGHTPEEIPVNESWRINIDTGAFWTGQLTALALEGRQRRFLHT